MKDLVALTLSALIAEVMDEGPADAEASPTSTDEPSTRALDRPLGT